MKAKKRIQLVFPGQGSQYQGMGKKFSNMPEFSDFLTHVDESIGYKLSDIMLTEDNESTELNLTANTQPAIVSYSCFLYKLIEKLLIKNGYAIDCVMGHSVGEYSALVACESLKVSDAVKITHLRGKAMQEAMPAGAGTMIALLKAPSLEVIELACQEVSSKGKDYVVEVANYNSPKQVVISGTIKGCESAEAWIQDHCKKHNLRPPRAIALSVSAPFHCSLMSPAAEVMEKVLQDTPIVPTKQDYIANINAQRHKRDCPAQVLKENLVQQICASVLWQQSIAQHCDPSIPIIEVGPSQVLKGLIQSINPQLNVFSLDSTPNWQECQEQVEQWLSNL